MDERKEVCWDKLHGDDFQLILSLLSPRDFVTMKQVCKSWELYLNSSAQGKKILDITGNLTFFDKIKAEMDIKQHPVFFWGISNLITCLIYLNDPESSFINTSLFFYMATFCMGAGITIAKSSNTFQDALNSAMNIKGMVEEASKLSCTFTTLGAINRFLLNDNHWGIFMIMAWLILGKADIGFESLNKYSLFYREKPKEAYNEISTLFRKNEVFNIHESEPLPKI